MIMTGWKRSIKYKPYNWYDNFSIFSCILIAGFHQLYAKTMGDIENCISKLWIVKVFKWITFNINVHYLTPSKVYMTWGVTIVVRISSIWLILLNCIVKKNERSIKNLFLDSVECYNKRNTYEIILRNISHNCILNKIFSSLKDFEKQIVASLVQHRRRIIRLDHLRT